MHGAPYTYKLARALRDKEIVQQMVSAKSSPDSFYRQFVERVKASVRIGNTEPEVRSLLDGAAADAVHTHVPRPIRSKDGIFFSGHALAEETSRFAEAEIKAGAKIFDPACGGGDLLIAAARLLPLQQNFLSTINAWGDVLGGSDLHQSFVDATKWRLALLAKSRHGINSNTVDLSFEEIFPHVRQADYLLDPTISNAFDCILVNPPFGHRTAPMGCEWSSGKTQFAAIFIDAILRHRKEGQTLIAVLPDVLRGGSRYNKWRQTMERMASHCSTKVYGRFEKRTDVDVFIIKYQLTPQDIKTQSHPPIPSATPSTRTVGDAFSINVGAVVPHRHPENKGSWKPYLTVSNAPQDGEVTVSSNRRFEGKCFQPPFVAIRRTSNPSDAQRIVCTIVLGTKAVAVENHLIVAKPINGSVEDCRQLVRQLKTAATTEHINNQLRCRHLTTGALKSIPLLGC